MNSELDYNDHFIFLKFKLDGIVGHTDSIAHIEYNLLPSRAPNNQRELTKLGL